MSRGWRLISLLREEAMSRLLGIGLALTAAALGLLSLRSTVCAEGRSTGSSLAPVIALSNGKLSVDLRDADLADVLQQIAPRALQRADQNVSERYLLQ
jgi:hypothetical protein